jgi:hypothetical protein
MRLWRHTNPGLLGNAVTSSRDHTGLSGYELSMDVFPPPARLRLAVISVINF